MLGLDAAGKTSKSFKRAASASDYTELIPLA